jgi:hypothetical protein
MRLHPASVAMVAADRRGLLVICIHENAVNHTLMYGSIGRPDCRTSGI